MQRAKGAAIADDDLSRDRFEGSAKMLHRLERDDALAVRLDAKRLELLQVQYLLSDSDEQDLDAGNAQNGGRAIRAVQPAEDRSVPYEMAVTDRDQLTFEHQGATAESSVDLAADSKADFLTDRSVLKHCNGLIS